MAAFILSKVDYCNVVLAGLPKRDLDRLQSVINAAARLTTGACRYDHITLLLKDLHWLQVTERITYKLCVLVYNCLHGSAPRNLQEVIQPIAEVTSRRRLQSSSSSVLQQRFKIFYFTLHYIYITIRSDEVSRRVPNDEQG